jgi:alkanesulfonate monooxygenase SsuD/methylene tetrahydromethanopterin reductase-like flavin-dependent oxidoreductase (luciferase family)
MIIDIQFNQGAATWTQVHDAVCVAESAGFATAWIADHLSGSAMNAPSMPECFTVLGALAASTSTIGLGSLVANVGNRYPGVLANAAATVQQISHGRFILGLGAGASPTSVFAAEQVALGIAIPRTMRARHDRLVASLDTLDELWSPTRRSELATFPLPDPRPLIILGVNSHELGRIAGARTDGVNIRATHRHRAEILASAIASANTAGRSGFIVSVWEWFDDVLLDSESTERRELEKDGVNRLILLMRGAPNIAQIRRAASRLP